MSEVELAGDGSARGVCGDLTWGRVDLGREGEREGGREGGGMGGRERGRNGGREGGREGGRQGGGGRDRINSLVLADLANKVTDDREVASQHLR